MARLLFHLADLEWVVLWLDQTVWGFPRVWLWVLAKKELEDI